MALALATKKEIDMPLFIFLIMLCSVANAQTKEELNIIKESVAATIPAIEAEKAILESDMSSDNYAVELAKLKAKADAIKVKADAIKAKHSVIAAVDAQIYAIDNPTVVDIGLDESIEK